MDLYFEISSHIKESHENFMFKKEGEKKERGKMFFEGMDKGCD